MFQIDLLDYAYRSKKIPKAYLKHQTPQHTPIANWKILAAFSLDFLAAVSVSLMISAFFKLYMQSFMISSGLMRSFDAIPFTSISLASIPLIFLSYHFFSYFFNQGQTWGMKYFKMRITVPEQNFTTSLQWSTFAFSTLLTGGLLFKQSLKKMSDQGSGQYASEDHLWVDLMQERITHPINLVEATQAFEEFEDIQKTEVAQAA